MSSKWMRVARAPAVVVALAACGDAADPADRTVEVPNSYAFESRFQDGSSVSHSGQVLRHLLIADMEAYIEGLTGKIDNLTLTPTAGDIQATLEEGFFDLDSDASPGVAILLSTDPEPLQSTYDEIGFGKDLNGKIAGNDPIGQHRDWIADGTVGVGDGSLSPEQVVRGWFAELDALAVDRANGTVPSDPEGHAIAEVVVTADGRNLQELLEIFLLGAVAFSQGTDDYLDDDTEGKGLLSDNTEAAPEDGVDSFTELEHAWDEGFGYFGAALDYGDYSDAMVADGEVIDSDGDGKTDLTGEYNFGHSQHAAERDDGSAAGARTDFSGEAFEGFLRGRAIITAAGGALSDAQMTELKAARDQAVGAWEKALAASIVHHVNALLVDTAAIGGDDYSFLDHAKHWSEMKGFALSLQFNPRSPLQDDLAQLHTLIGDAPVLAGDAELDAYADDLRAARALVAAAYGFDAANVGDDDGLGGW